MNGESFRPDFEDRLIVVTGGARGQGAAEVELLARSHARVVIADVRVDQGNELAERLASAGHHVRFVQLDVTDRSSWQSLAADVRAREGSLWGLVNNAGITVPGRVENVKEEEWQRALEVNSWGALIGTQTVAPIMHDGGSIVNVGSVASHLAHTGVAYSASKFALRAITKSSVVELAKYNIRVNQVDPGYIKTDLNVAGNPRFFEAHLALTPMARSGTTAEIARVVRFLLSDESSYVSGAEIPVDGGFTSPGGTKPIFDAVGPAIPRN